MGMALTENNKMCVETHSTIDWTSRAWALPLRRIVRHVVERISPLHVTSCAWALPLQEGVK